MTVLTRTALLLVEQVFAADAAVQESSCIRTHLAIWREARKSGQMTVSQPTIPCGPQIEGGTRTQLVQQFAAATPPQRVQSGAALVLAENESRRVLLSAQDTTFVVRIAQAGRYWVYANGTGEIDPVAVLRKDGTVVADDDDGGAGLNARIEVDLQPGDYQLAIRDFDRAEGEVTVGVTRVGPVTTNSPAPPARL